MAEAMKFDIAKLNSLLDGNYTPDAQSLIDRGWQSSVSADSINHAEAEWLAKALPANQELVLACYDSNGIVSLKTIRNERDSILSSIFEYGEYNIFITDYELSFIFYFEQNNRYFLISGSSEFVKSAHPMTVETSQLMFYDWIDSGVNSKEEREFLINVWAKYCI